MITEADAYFFCHKKYFACIIRNKNKCLTHDFMHMLKLHRNTTVINNKEETEEDEHTNTEKLLVSI